MDIELGMGLTDLPFDVPAYRAESDAVRKEAELVLRNNVMKGEGTANEVAAVANLDGAFAGGHQFLVGDDAQLVIDGGGEVFRADRVGLRRRSRGIRRAIDRAPFDAAPG